MLVLAEDSSAKKTFVNYLDQLLLVSNKDTDTQNRARTCSRPLPPQQMSWNRVVSAHLSSSLGLPAETVAQQPSLSGITFRFPIKGLSS
jgi:hypothetical protein